MEKRRTVIGIDTGGTYTDGILMDVITKKVLSKIKTPTTSENLSIGIGKCIDRLKDGKEGSIAAVCISTTLATNHVVEKKSCRIGLVLMREGMAAAPEFACADMTFDVSGEIDHYGNIVSDVDMEQIERCLCSMRGKVDALVVSGYMCVRNPSHEIAVKEKAERVLGVPVICAHELSMSLGFGERTTTAVLNARLLPVIADLIAETKKAMKRNGITARLMVVKGDGTMMGENAALKRPVETVLSGPAASVMGGAYLSGMRTAVFADLGGTTLDIASMNDSRVLVNEEGAVVGERRTKVRAADVRTYGLGGDSRLKTDGDRIYFGPERAIPVSYGVLKNPSLLDEMAEVKKAGEDAPVIWGFKRNESLVCCTEDTNRYEDCGLSSVERRVLEIVRNAPHTIPYIASRLERRERLAGIDGLMERGIVRVVSLTPTDIAHFWGEMSGGNVDAVQLCVRIAAREINETSEKFVARAADTFLDSMAFAVIRSALSFDGRCEEEMGSRWLYDMLFKQGDMMEFNCRLKRPVVAMGAPARIWLTKLKERLGNIDIVVPDNYEVANAVGAAVGIVRKTVEILICHDTATDRYIAHMPWGMCAMESYDNAEEYARKRLCSFAEDASGEMEGYSYSIAVRVEKSFVDAARQEGIPYEAKVILEMTGKNLYD